MQAKSRKRIIIGAGAVLLLMVAVLSVFWYRCGLRGCPDVDMLKGYMPEQASVLLDREGEEIGKLFLERHQVVSLDSLPEHVPNAFIAVEDRRFWTHGGVDWRRVAGALVSNVKSGEIEEGSSTITMQLARNVFPEQLPAHKKTIWRKLGEARVARQIESRYAKREILELYLNQIYFGSGAYGIESAAQEYFGKRAGKLTLAEAALLASLPRAPSRLNPRANEEAALAGQKLVLERMAAQGLITAEERSKAAEAELQLKRSRPRSANAAPYFVEEVRSLLENQLGNALYTEGYNIHTTLDLTLQRVAEQELRRQIEDIESGRFGTFPHPTRTSLQADTADRSRGTPYLQGAAVFIDANTGDVLALIGGRDFRESQFNRATNAERQPGSAFKPFVYAAALKAGFAPTHRLVDQPLRYVLDNGRVWEPANYENSYAGAVSMREALTYSKNVATVRLASEIGLGSVLGMAEQMGLGAMPPHPSVVLGTGEVTPLRLTLAYAAFATLGQRPEARFVTHVTDRDGVTVWSQQPDVRSVIDPASAFLTTSLMQDVVNRGTGTGVRAAGFRGPAAGKTGTTQDAADIWFVGFTPEVVGSIWIGFDRRERILRRATGGELVAPVWGRIMTRAGMRGSDWMPPSGIEEQIVDEMGAVVASGCTPVGGTRTEYFLSGTAPMTSCYPTGYAMYDSLGYYNSVYDSIYADTLGSTSDPGWWDRLRRRFFGGDTVRTVPDSLGVPRPGTRDTMLITPIPDSLGRIRPDSLGVRIRSDSLGVRPTTARPGMPSTMRPALPRVDSTRPVRQPIGRPINPRPRPDTLGTVRSSG